MAEQGRGIVQDDDIRLTQFIQRGHQTSPQLKSFPCHQRRVKVDADIDIRVRAWITRCLRAEQQSKENGLLGFDTLFNLRHEI